jgi:predicted GNAT family acetyltransferase
MRNRSNLQGEQEAQREEAHSMVRRSGEKIIDFCPEVHGEIEFEIGRVE